MEHYISKNRLDSLSNLEEEMQRRLRELGESARAGGNNILSENPAFMEERSKIIEEFQYKKKKLLQNNKFIVIEETEQYKNFDGTSVIVGCHVDLEYDGEKEHYQILGENEADITKGIISCNAPFCEELVGRKVGEEFDYRGSLVKILSVSL